MNSDFVSLWRQCTVHIMDTATLQTIINLVREFEQQWGRWPTPEDIRARLQGPDSLKVSGP